MKLTTRDISGFLAQPRKAKGVLLYGPDLGLVRFRLQEIAAKILSQPDDPFARVELSAEQVAADPARLHDELSSFSLMGGARLIIVRDASDSLTETLAASFDAASEQSYLAICAGDLQARSSLRASVEKHPAIAALPCYKDEGAALDTLIRDTFTGYGLRVGPEVVRYLAASLGGDRMIVLSEIEKISLYAGDEAETVSLDDVMALVGDVSDRGLDALNEAVAGGNAALAMEMLDKLTGEGAHGVVIVRSLMRYFQRLREVRMIAAAQGSSVEQAVESLRPPVFFKLKPVLIRHTQRWDIPRLERALSRLLALEIETKRYHDQQEARLGQALLGLIQLSAPRRAA